MEGFRKPNLKDIGRVGAALLFAASALTPTPVNAGETITLTPPGGSVTPGAFGRVNVEVLSRNPGNDLVELLINGELNGLVPGRLYKVWACWDSIYDCSTNAYPKIKTDENGSASFLVSQPCLAAAYGINQ